jgi:hypothetical protein
MTERQFSIAGAVIYWKLAGRSDRSVLESGFAAAGHSADCPSPICHRSALRDALTEHKGALGKTVLIRQLADVDAFALVDEQRGEHSNDYRHLATVRVRDGGGLCFEAVPESVADLIDGSYQLALSTVGQGELSRALVSMVDKLHGISLRPKGGIYWLPESALATWGTLCAFVEQAGKGSEVWQLRTAMDAQALQAIRDGLSSQILSEAETMRDEIASGELGERAIETRRKLCAVRRQKVDAYKLLLGESLADLDKAIDAIEEALLDASTQALPDMSDSLFSGLGAYAS